LVCQPKSHPGAVVLTEVKCRQSDDYDTVPSAWKAVKSWTRVSKFDERKWQKEHPTQLLPPYDDKPLTIRNLDQLQLGWTQLMYKETNPKVVVRGSMALRAHRHGIHTYPLEPWVLDPARLPFAEARMQHVRGRRKTKPRRVRSKTRVV
jgi:hypothetical protein